MVYFNGYARLRRLFLRLFKVSCPAALLLAAGVLSARLLPAQAPENGTPYPDSLLRILQRSKTDTAKARVLYLLADYWSERDSAQAFRYVREGMHLSRSSPYMHALGYFYLAGNYFQSNIPLSERYYLKTDSLLRPYKTPEAYTFRSRSWHNYGVLQQIQDSEKAFAEILIGKVIPLAEKAGDTTRVGRAYVSLGIVFTNQLDYKKAVSYFKKAEAILSRRPSPDPGLMELYLKFSRTYIFLKQFKEVSPYLVKTKKLLDRDPASPFWPDYFLAEGMYFAGVRRFPDALTSLNME